MSKAKRRIAIRIDMTPMVDIAFLLLIFYMASTQFKPPEARAVELPSSHSRIELPDKDKIFITVTKDDSIYVDYLMMVKMNVEGKEVETNARIVIQCEIEKVTYEIQKARGAIRNKNNDNPYIVIKADKEASFGTIDDIMSSMQVNDLGRFLVITEPETDPGII